MDIDTEFFVRNLPFTSLCARGRLRAAAGNLISALNCFHEATTKRQDDYDALTKVEAADLHAAYADVLVRMDGGHNKNALNEAEKSLALDPANGTAAHTGALASFRLEELSKAGRLIALAKTLAGLDDARAGEIEALAVAVRGAVNRKERRVCAFSGCESHGRYRCSRCHGAYYCGKAHQTTDWKVHKKACGDLRMSVEAKADAEVERLLKDQYDEAFGGKATKLAKIMKERMERESNAPRNEQLSIFLNDVKDFCTHCSEIAAMPRVWTLNPSAVVEFSQRDMGIFTTRDGLQMYKKAIDTARGATDLRKWFENLRRKVGRHTGSDGCTSFVVSLAVAAFDGVKFYRSEKNRMVMPVVDDIATAIALGSAHPRYTNFVDLLGDCRSTATEVEAGDVRSQDDEDEDDYYEDEDDYNSGLYHDDDDEHWSYKSDGAEVNPESEVQYDEEARARLLVAVAIGAARSIAVRMEGTPGLLWQGGGMVFGS